MPRPCGWSDHETGQSTGTTDRMSRQLHVSRAVGTASATVHVISAGGSAGIRNINSAPISTEYPTECKNHS